MNAPNNLPYHISDDSKTARRTLVFVAIATLVVASFDSISGQLDIFGVIVSTSQERIVKLGQVFTVFSAFVFYFRELPQFIRAAHARKKKVLIEDQRIRTLRLQDDFSLNEHREKPTQLKRFSTAMSAIKNMKCPFSNNQKLERYKY